MYTFNEWLDKWQEAFPTLYSVVAHDAKWVRLRGTDRDRYIDCAEEILARLESPWCVRRYSVCGTYLWEANSQWWAHELLARDAWDAFHAWQEEEAAWAAFKPQFLARYQEFLDATLPIERQLKVTDDLMNQIVYRLYGLNEGEIAMVEGRELPPLTYHQLLLFEDARVPRPGQI